MPSMLPLGSIEVILVPSCFLSCHQGLYREQSKTQLSCPNPSLTYSCNRGAAGMPAVNYDRSGPAQPLVLTATGHAPQVSNR